MNRPDAANLTDFPVELLEKIIGEIVTTHDNWQADVYSLCLVNRSFVAPCQAALFENVTMRSPPGSHIHFTPNEPEDLTARFSASIRAGPHLAQYVRSLTYIVPMGAPVVTDPNVVFALGKMTRLTEFHLGVDTSEGRYRYTYPWMYEGHRTPEKTDLCGSDHFQRDAVHADALLSVLRLPSLGLLSLKKVKISTRALYGAPGLKTLRLEEANCYIQGDDIFPGSGLGVPPHISSVLSINADQSLVPSTLAEANDHTGGPTLFPLDYSKIKNLALVETRSWIDAKLGRGAEALLARLENLETLEVKTFQSYHYNDSDPRITVLAFDKLHKSAFATLTSLMVTQLVETNDRNLCNLFKDPWKNFADSALPNLRALRVLELTIRVKHLKSYTDGPEPLPPLDTHFDETRWGRLDTTLTSSGSGGLRNFRQLKRVAIIYGVQLGDRTDIGRVLPYLERDDEPLGWYKTHILGKHYEGLRGMHRNGELSDLRLECVVWAHRTPLFGFASPRDCSKVKRKGEQEQEVDTNYVEISSDVDDFRCFSFRGEALEQRPERLPQNWSDVLA